MRVHYYPETDSLYIDLSERAASDSHEISEGVVGDFDGEGRLVGIDIDRASEWVSLNQLEAESLPLDRVTMLASGRPGAVPGHRGERVAGVW